MNLDRRCIFGRVSEWVIILMPWTCLITLYLPHCVDSEGHMCVSMCVFMCALRMSLLPPLREQAGYLAAMSQPVLLTDKLCCLSQWMTEQHVWMCLCVYVCAATPGHCKYTKAIFVRAQFDFNIYRPSGHVSIPLHGSNLWGVWVCLCYRICFIAWCVKCLKYAVTHSRLKTHTSVFLTYSIFILLRPRC